MIGELDWRFNDERYSWVAQDDWTYSRVITLPHTPALLVCDGLMTLATVVLDGKVLGEANNQYRRWLFPLPTTPSQDPQNATLSCASVRPCRSNLSEIILAIGTRRTRRCLVCGRSTSAGVTRGSKITR